MKGALFLVKKEREKEKEKRKRRFAKLTRRRSRSRDVRQRAKSIEHFFASSSLARSFFLLRRKRPLSNLFRHPSQQKSDHYAPRRGPLRPREGWSPHVATSRRGEQGAARRVRRRGERANLRSSSRVFSCFLLPMAKRFLFFFSSSRSRALSPSPSLFLLLSARGMTLDTDELHPHEQKTQRKNQQQVLASSGAAAGTAAARSSSEAATAANFLHAAAAAAVSSSWASLVALPRK